MTEKKFLMMNGSYTTINGVEIKKPVVAYEEYGNANGPVVLLCHGGLSNQHAADVTLVDPAPGWWDALVGPGNVFDTNIFRILCLNALGSMFGTSSAITVNPDTGKPYGKDFPYVTMEDHARFLKQALEELGVKKVFWAAGPSMGSLTILNLAVLFPEFVGAVTPVATSAYMTAGGMAFHNATINGIRHASGWNDGDYEDNSVLAALIAMAQINKVYFTHYSLFENMVDNINDQYEREQKLSDYLEAGSEAYAKAHDANCVISCMRACNSFSLANGFNSLDEAFARMKMPALVINVDTDSEFPPHYGKEIVDGINLHHPGMAEHSIIHSVYGHLGCVLEGDQLKEVMVPFKEKLLKAMKQTEN